MAFGEDFLTVPDLFPARFAGEGWGTGTVSLDLAAGPYRIRGLAPEQLGSLAERYSVCEELPEGSITEIRVYSAPDTDFLPIDRRGWTYAMDIEHEAHQVRIAGDRWMGLIEVGASIGGALWTSIPHGTRWDELFENFFRIVVAYRVLATGGVLLHSSGVVHGDGAVAFFGPSGAGKTTVARLSQDRGKSVLSDDINALFRTEQGLVARKMPFAGELGPTEGSSAPHPVFALCRLEKATDNVAIRMPRATAVAALLASAPFLNQDPYRLDALSGALETITDEIPTLKLSFDLSGDFWTCLEEALE